MGIHFKNISNKNFNTKQNVSSVVQRYLKTGLQSRGYDKPLY